MIYPLLYKRSVTGKVSTWQVEVENNCFRTTSGFEDGQKVTSAWTCCEAKSYNTSDLQAVAEASAMWRKRTETGYWENKSKIDTPVYFKPMLAHDYNDYKVEIENLTKARKNGFSLRWPLYSQPKLDGIRCIIRADGMWSRNGKPIISAPHIFEALQHLFEEDPDLILDGELYAERGVCDFNTIISCVRKTKPTLQDILISRDFIQYWVYDVPSVDDTFCERERMLYGGIALPDCCRKVLSTRIGNAAEANKQLAEYIEEGYEGQMLRADELYENKRSKALLKHKTFVDAEFTILGYTEGIGNLSEKIGTLLFKTKEGIEFNAAVNGTHEYLAELWNIRDSLVGKEATVKYFEKTVDGSLRFPKVINIDRNSYE